ncbi:potassium-transporting ATPase subunit KdpC [Paenibacillus sp. GCM10023248]|uniref:potassium-transporting ATPase subunit KdpC n=1 Tax=Bacillales TaxID=1385 RepID=UPI002378FD24|nr:MULTISPECIES: potassium-transporting ATPase subunit KdpC [Bacillales]MDD9267019.1 potassium-transporting ATPase subunit KdpC [Paenibacillus sp. MAHUQ-63]MDR6881220.1 K+-transporting ATPase ATPase C chain [Bacillus sp. 3255]
MKSVGIAIRISVLLMVVCGLIYPLVTTGVAQLLFPKQANGSLVEAGGTVAGSELLAQGFASPKLFHPRASAAGYNPAASSGSNMAVASSDYAAAMAEKVEAWKKENPALTDIPAELVTVSGSGFDPDLSPEGAKAQVPRISKETGIGERQLNELVDRLTKGRQLGVFGEPRVNVTELNMELLKQVKM